MSIACAFIFFRVPAFFLWGVGWFLLGICSSPFPGRHRPAPALSRENPLHASAGFCSFFQVMKSCKNN